MNETGDKEIWAKIVFSFYEKVFSTEYDLCVLGKHTPA